jgi:hypothetical protein
MPYSKSASIKRFEARVSDLARVARVANALKIGGVRYNATYRDAMLSSSILLSFAYFEAYFADITNDVAKALCSSKIQASALSQDLRVQIAVASQLDGWSEIQDPAKRRKQIWAHKASNGFLLLEDAHVPASLGVSNLLSGISYPKPDNVKKLLSRFGIGDPLKELKAKGGHAVMQKLTSIHDARAELAHTGRLPSWSPMDYQDRLREIVEFAKSMDRVLWTYVRSAVPATCWIR